MSNWNYLMNSHFRGCVDVGTMPDPHRDRVITAYILPGDDTNLGFSDGVDAWISPRHDYMRKLKKAEAPMAVVRRRVVVDAAPIVRRRIVNGR